MIGKVTSHTETLVVSLLTVSFIGDILGNMGTDAQTIQNIAGGDYSSLYPALIGIGSGLINGNLEDAMNGVFTSLGNIFPNATTADGCSLAGAHDIVGTIIETAFNLM